MMRVRLKADGRIVEILPDGSERTVDHSNPAHFVRQVRARCGLTQAAFAEKIEVPIETVRNWEQGKRSPRGPARALLKVIDKAPDVAFAVLRRDQAQSTDDIGQPTARPRLRVSTPI